MQITNGTIEYGRVLKTGDFENKKGTVTLSYSVAEGEDADVVSTEVMDKARALCYDLLGIVAPRTAADLPGETQHRKPGPAPGTKRAMRIPSVSPIAAKEVEKLNAMAEGGTDVIPETPKPSPKAAATDMPEEPAKAPKEPELPGTQSKEITDVDLTAAVNRHQEKVKNPVAIRGLISELTGKPCPPARMIDIAQEHRQEFLDRLVQIKPVV